MPGRGAPNKTPSVAAVAKNHAGRPIALRMNVVAGFRKADAKFIYPDSIVVGDALACFRGIAEAGVELPERKWVNTIVGNVKTAMKGAYHKAGSQYLLRYLGEFCYRFNRPFNLAVMLPRLAVVAVRTPPMPYRLLKLAEAHW